ncbi:MAG TPA: hypothetical protein VK982_02110 [Bacteroidales bacterium]|nr:hypothetical protein [Bacteroidales bacterium]
MNKDRLKAIQDSKDEYVRFILINLIALAVLLNIEYYFGIYRSIYYIPCSLFPFIIAFKLSQKFYQTILAEVYDGMKEIVKDLEYMEKKMEEKNKKK